MLSIFFSFIDLLTAFSNLVWLKKIIILKYVLIIRGNKLWSRCHYNAALIRHD